MYINCKKISCVVTLLWVTVASAIPENTGSLPQTSNGTHNEERYSVEEARAAVVEAFEHSWRGYAANAFGADEVNPLNGQRSYSRYHHSH